MNKNIISKEQIAHDLTVNLCMKSISEKILLTEAADIDTVVQEYALLYDKVLASVNKQL